MTTTSAGGGRYMINRNACVAVMIAAVTLAGCASDSGILGSTGSTEPQTQLAPAQPAPTRLSIAPVIGAPDGVAKQLAQDFSAAVSKSRVTIVGPQDKADYALRGYIVAAKEKAAHTKVSYIWDVTDPAGKRVNRITGEEVVSSANASDPWVAVTPQITQTIAQKAAGSLVGWLSQNASTPVAAAPQAVPAATSPTSVASIPPATSPMSSTAPRMAAAAPTPSTAPQNSGPIAAVIPSLVGASGDGNNTLASALQAELAKNGIGTASQGGQPYRVEGVVKMGEAKDGKQPVQIDWNVKDPQGKRLGTVTQKNEIAAGSLDGSWGGTATAAAAAAAQGILKLLPRTTASN